MGDKIGELKVGGIVYDVVHSEGLSETDYWGYYNPESCKITIDAKVNCQRKKETIIHELLHAVFYQSGIYHRINKDDEEYIVDMASRVLLQVLQDNDFSFISEGKPKKYGITE